MPHPIVQHLSQLLRSGDPVRARYALLLLEGHLPHLTREDVQKAIDDLDPSIERELRGITLRLRKELPYHLGPVTRVRSVLTTRTVPPALKVLYPEHDLEATIEEARSLTEPLVAFLVEELQKSPGTNAEWAWRSLGALGHPAMVGPVIRAFEKGEGTETKLRAIMGVDTDPARAFVERLATGDSSWRAIALEGLWIQGDAALGSLRTAAKATDFPIRLSAAKALTWLGTPEALQVLSELASDPVPDVAIRALGGLALHADAGISDRMVKLGESIDDFRAYLDWLHLLGILGTPTALAKLQQLLEHADARVRGQAALCLASYPGVTAAVVDRLRLVMERSPPTEIAHFLLALFPHDPNHVEEKLKAELASEERLRRLSAVMAIRFIQTPGLVEAMIESHKSEEDVEVIQVQRKALLALDPRTPVSAFRPFVDHVSPRIRQTGILLMEGSSDKAARAHLESVLTSEIDFTVRQWATQALLRITKKESPDQLKNILSGKDSRVIASVVEDMADLPSAEVVPALLPMLGHPSNRVRASAIVSLFRQGRFEGMEHLEQLLEDPGGPGFSAGLYALDQLGTTFLPTIFVRSQGLVIALHDRADGRSKLDQASKMVIDLGNFPSQSNIPIMPRRRSTRTTRVSQLIDLTTTNNRPILREAGPESELEPILAQLLAGDPQGELELRNHLAKHPKDDAARYLLLKFLLASGVDTGDLVNEFAGRAAGGFVNPYLEVGRFLKEVGKVQKALMFYIRAFESKMMAIQALLDLTKKAAERGRVADANRGLEVMGSLMPVDPSLHATLGEHYLSLKEFDLAFQEFYRAHLSFPENDVISLKLAAIAAKTRRRRLAIRILDSIIDGGTDDNEVLERAKRLREKLTKE